MPLTSEEECEGEEIRSLVLERVTFRPLTLVQ